MEQQPFWLADINDHSVTISLISLINGSYQVASIGPSISYEDSPESFISATDKSLSDSATAVNLPDTDEPNYLALIIPPFWIDSDGKITSEKLKLFNQLFKELKLKPMGFIASDEAVVEEANLSDGFPASFVLVNFSDHEMVVSLTYLGKVIERISKSIDDGFDPNLLESTLLEFHSDSTLPPQIILTGDITSSILESVKNFSWVGKKSIETFLHFPDIKHYDQNKVTGIYLKAIISQLQPPLPVTSEPVVESEPITSDLVEVDASDFGFVADQSPVETTPEAPPEIIEPEPVITDKPPQKIALPKFSLPKIRFHLPSVNLFFTPLVFSPLLILIPFFFSTANITLFLTPYEFSKTLEVTFDPEAKDIDLIKRIIPINRQSLEINSSATAPTTGNKTVGDKAIGEVVVYNKQDKTQSLAKGTILIDTAGNKYELTTAAQIASSSANLDLGVINLGQTKVMVSAVDIGPEYNLGKDSKLHFKDFPETTILAKVSLGLTGGTKRQISAVSATDKANLEQQLSTKITTAVDETITKKLSETPDIIKDAVQISKGRIEYNREVGEEADELSATSVSTVYIFHLDQSQKSQLLSAFLSPEPGFSDSKYSLNDFTFKLNPSKKSIDQIKGQLVVTGKSIPKLNTVDIAKLLSGKSQTTAAALIKKNYPRVYNYQINTNFSFLSSINPLPFRLQNIKIEIK